MLSLILEKGNPYSVVKEQRQGHFMTLPLFNLKPSNTYFLFAIIEIQNCLGSNISR